HRGSVGGSPGRALLLRGGAGLEDGRGRVQPGSFAQAGQLGALLPLGQVQGARARQAGRPALAGQRVRPARQGVLRVERVARQEEVLGGAHQRERVRLVGRLSALIALVALAGCDDDKREVPPPPPLTGRSNVVVAKETATTAQTVAPKATATST